MTRRELLAMPIVAALPKPAAADIARWIQASRDLLDEDQQGYFTVVKISPGGNPIRPRLRTLTLLRDDGYCIQVAETYPFRLGDVVAVAQYGGYFEILDCLE